MPKVTQRIQVLARRPPVSSLEPCMPVTICSPPPTPSPPPISVPGPWLSNASTSLGQTALCPHACTAEQKWRGIHAPCPLEEPSASDWWERVCKGLLSLLRRGGSGAWLLHHFPEVPGAAGLIAAPSIKGLYGLPSVLPDSGSTS